MAAVVVTAGSATVVTAPATAAAGKPWTRTSDFNGDGYNDLATGAPGGTIAGEAGAGYVTILPGSKKGLVPAKKGILSQATAGVAGAPAEGKGFGETLATADFNADGYADLVTFFRQVGGSHSFSLFTGSKAGLRTSAVATNVYDGGADLALGDLNRDGRADLVVGRPVTGRFGPNLSGEVLVFNGTRTGFTEEATPSSPRTAPACRRPARTTVFNGGANGAIARNAKAITPKSIGAPVKAARFGWSLAR